jgi:hypothetical protein
MFNLPSSSLHRLCIGDRGRYQSKAEGTKQLDEGIGDTLV